MQLKRQLSYALFHLIINDDNFLGRHTHHFSPGPTSSYLPRSMLYEIAVTNTCDYIYGRDSLCSDPQALSDICNTNFRNTPEKINRPCNEKSPQVKHVTKLCTAATAVAAGAGAASGNKDNERVEPLTADHRLLVDMLLGWLVI